MAWDLRRRVVVRSAATARLNVGCGPQAVPGWIAGDRVALPNRARETLFVEAVR
jgi:hypothetical protein